MHAVYKYALELTDMQSIYLSKGAKILHVDEQHGLLQLWAIVDPGGEPELRTIFLAGTGVEIPNPRELEHINTFLMMSGELVWHAFEVKDD